MTFADPRRLSLRGRLLLIGLAGVAVALAIGSITLYVVLNLAGQRALDDTARNTATEVAALVRGGTIPEPLPVSGAQLVQVVDGRGRVIGSSVTADRLASLLRPGELATGRSGTHLTVPGSRAGLVGPLRVVAEPVTAPVDRTPDQATVVVAVQAGDFARARSVLRQTLLATFPLLLAVLGLLAWWVIGRTLRPVERLRASAETISGAGRDERLPVPTSVDEVRALAITLNQMLDRLTAARERQRDFVADAAHELRSPLASMRTQLEVAQHLGEGGELPADLLADVARLSTLVEDLLLLARLEQPVAAREHAAGIEVSALLTEVAGRYAAARVPVTVLIPASSAVPASGTTPVQQGRPIMQAGPVPPVVPVMPVRVAMDGLSLRRVLTNVADNAVRHAQSRVTLSLQRTGDTRQRVLLVVADDGPGIPVDQRDRVFERFARLDGARDRDSGGSGLGLAIVRELVQRAGGTVTLADNPAASDLAGTPGLRVEIRLPGTS